MKPTIGGAVRLTGFDKPTVWTVMTPLAIQTKSVNLVPPSFTQGTRVPLLEASKVLPRQPHRSAHQQYMISIYILLGNHQYVRAFGSLTYTKAIADFHKKTFKNLDIENNIVTSNGGVEGLYCCFAGLVNEGEEVILFDPSYDCYRPQVQMSGGKCVGIPLKPRTNVINPLVRSAIQTVDFSQAGEGPDLLGKGRMGYRFRCVREGPQP